MAKRATAKTSAKPKAKRKSVAKPKRATPARRESAVDAGDAFVKLLQSPLVAELVAVAATSALAALAEHGFTSRGGGGTTGNRAGRAVKEAGEAAAAAVGRRLTTELDEIRKASKSAKGGAKA
jgi:hypothetical protein